MNKGRLPVALNVAEKPSVAKTITEILKIDRYMKKPGRSKFNPNFEFETKIRGNRVSMISTSVCGHIKQFQFPIQCRSWHKTKYISLFTTPLDESIIDKSFEIVENLKHLASRADILFLWLDCDREGEAIAEDVIEVCREVNPNIEVLRAHFSALTKRDIEFSI